MSCESLICAHCAGPVSEGRCAVCRAGRAHVHSHGPSPTLVALALLCVLLLTVLAERLAG